MIGGIITSGLRLAVAAGITKVAETVFTKLVKPKQSTDDDKTILPSSTAKNIIKDILDLKNPVVIPENTDKKLVQQLSP